MGDAIAQHRHFHIAINPSLGELSDTLKTVIQAQQDQGHRLMINIIDDRGELIATPDPRRILQTVLDELPGADQALRATRPHSWIRSR